MHREAPSVVECGKRFFAFAMDRQESAVFQRIGDRFVREVAPSRAPEADGSYRASREARVQVAREDVEVGEFGHWDVRIRRA